jgi:hypothetical protein
MGFIAGRSFLHRGGERRGDHRIGRHGAQRVHHAHMRHAADRLQHVGRDHHALLRRFAQAPDILQRRGAARVFLDIDTKCRQGRRDRIGEGAGMLRVEDARLHVAQSQAQIGQAATHALQAEPAQMRVVEQSARLIIPGAAQQLLREAPMLQVRDADQDGAVGCERFDMAAQHGPGIAQVLQDVAVDDAIDAVRQFEWQWIEFDIDLGHLVEPFGGDGRHRGVAVDGQQACARIALAVGGQQRASAAADVEHDLGRQRNALEQVEIGQVGIGRHGREGLSCGHGV